MKYFCSKCGKTTQYTFEIPSFCAFCGQSFANKLASPQAVEQGNKFLNELKLKRNINSVREEEVENVQEEHINFKQVKAKYKLNIYKNKGESFGDLIDNPQELIESSIEKSNTSKSTEEILQEFQSEAGSLRSK